MLDKDKQKLLIDGKNLRIFKLTFRNIYKPIDMDNFLKWFKLAIGSEFAGFINNSEIS